MVPQTKTPDRPSYEELLERVVRLERVLTERDRRIAELEQLLEQSRRSGKRQAAPFSKGSAKFSPKRPGRKSGALYGRQATRAIPGKVDQHIVVGCPLFCPHCDGEVKVTGKTDQYQTELPPVRAVTLCANMSETAYPWDISEQGGEGIRDNHGRSRGV